MTISSSATRKAGPYNCNGATTNFAFTFKVFSSADLVVTLTDADGVETTLVLTTDYSVSLNADQNANPGGSITTVQTYSASYDITITSDVAATQPTDLTSGGGWYPDTVENALDRAIVLIQQLEELALRTMVGPVSDSAAIGELPNATSRALKFLSFDANGDPIAATSVTSSAVTAFMATVLAATNAYAARGFLGVPAYLDGAIAPSLNMTVERGNVTAVNLLADAIVFQNTASFMQRMLAKDAVSDGYLGSQISSGAISPAVSGAGGLDTGSEANSTWYAVYMIAKNTGTDYAGLLSASFTAPTMPTGYTQKALVSAIYNGSGGDFRPMRQRGRHVVCEPVTILSAGSDTAVTALGTLLATAVPPIAREVLLEVTTYRASGSAAETTTLYASNATTFPVCTHSIPADATTTPNVTTVKIPLDTAQALWYANANSTGRTTLRVLGYSF